MLGWGCLPGSLGAGVGNVNLSCGAAELPETRPRGVKRGDFWLLQLAIFQLVIFSGGDVGGVFENRVEAVLVGVLGALFEVFDRRERGDFLGDGGGDELVHGDAIGFGENLFRDGLSVAQAHSSRGGAFSLNPGLL